MQFHKMEIVCYNPIAGKLFCGQKNSVALAPRPASGKAFCGKCGGLIATYKGTDAMYRIIPRKFVRRKRAEYYM